MSQLLPEGSTIGIIAGGGQFPRLIAQEARRRGLRVAVSAFHGHTDPELEKECDVFQLLHLGQLNRMLNWFHEQSVQAVCMAGTINKPKALDFRPDFRAAKVLFSLRSKGDDALLRAVLGELEKESFRVLSAADIVPTLRCPEGTLTRREPTEEEWSDIRYGWPILAEMGRMDIGQCIVVRQNMVVAVECLEGTDATLRRAAELGGKGCVALKMVKPGQDERVDLPSIGLTTITNLVELKYSALIVEAGRTLFFDREQSLALADKHKLAVVALPRQ